MWREGTSTADFADAVANVSHVTLPMDGADRVTIPDTELLFSAKYSRAGSDLVLSGADGHKLIVTGYFDHEKHADLVAPGGASLSADLVAKLTISQTPGQYAQAGAPAGGMVIGKVERLGGTATVQHANGTVEELHVGDPIYQGDVIETGGGSQVGLSLNDGTAFNMGASARMVLNELTYDTAGSANAGIFSLVRGSISFVAGQVAKNGDMRVETPVATMGIRGTTVNTTINADINGNVVSVTYSLMADPDGHIGSFNLLDKTTGAIIGTISTTDTTFFITPSANLSVLAQQLDKTPEQVQQELAIAQMLFPIFLSNPANFLTNPNPNVNPNDLQPKKGAVGSGGYLDYQGHSTGLGDVTALNVQTTLINETVTVGIIRDNGNVPETVTQTIQVELPNNFPPLITGDTPPHLKEAPSNFENGSTSVAQLTKSDIDGTATYDIAALLAAGWTDNHNGTFSKDGQYGTATLNTNNNTLTYQLDQTKADPLNVDDHPVEDFTIPAVDNQGATNSTVVSFTIDGANDAPTITASVNHHLVEASGHSLGVWTATATLTKGDVDGTASYDAAALSAGGWFSLGFGIYTKIGHYGLATLNTNTGKVTYLLDNLRANSLAEGETVHDNFTVPVKDDRGATGSTSVSFTIDGTNDNPVIFGKATGAVTEDGGPCEQIATGQLNAADVDHGATAAWSVVGNPAGTYGSISIDNSGKWTYTLDNDSAVVQALAQGQIRFDTFTIKVTDDQGGTDTQIVKIKVTGTNDVPTVDAVVDHHLVEASGSNAGVWTATATLTKGDVDGAASYDTAALWSDGWVTFGFGIYFKLGNYGLATLDINSGKVTYVLDNVRANALNVGDHPTDDFTIPVKDNLGATNSTVVSFTIDGTNDAPVILVSLPQPLLLIEDSVTSAVAHLTKGDVDGTADYDADALTSHGWTDNNDGTFTKEGQYGTATLNTATNTVTYALDQAKVDPLASGQTVTESFYIGVVDNNGATSSASASFIVTGTNDAPVVDLDTGTVGSTATLEYIESDPLTAIAPHAAVTDVDSANFKNGSLTVSFTANGTSSDQLKVLTDSVVTVTVAHHVKVDGVDIGTISGSNNGVNGAPLKINFNSNATPDAVSTLMQHIGFENTSSDPSNAPRTVTFKVVDGDGVIFNGHDTGQMTATITVQPVTFFVGGPHSNYTTIQAAIDAAHDGDVILVAAGTYNESLNINKGVKILGANAGVDGDGSRGPETIITGQSQITTGQQVVIDGVEFLDDRAYTLSIGDNFVALKVLIQSAAGHIIENSVFLRDPVSDPPGFNATSFVGSGNMPTHRGLEIAAVVAGTSIIVQNNFFTGGNTYPYAGDDWRSAIYSNGGAGTTLIADNTFTNARSAINADNFSATVTITGNQFANDGTAVSVGVGSDVANVSTITGNTFDHVDSEFNFQNLTTPVSFDAVATGNAATGEAMQILGGSAGDTLTSGNGNDVIAGNAGADTIHTGAGDDTIVDFTSGDQVDGGSDTDTIVLTGTGANALAGASDTDIVNVEAVSAAGATAGVTIDLHSQSEGFVITGSANNDTITGSKGADTIHGGAGTDTVVYLTDSTDHTVIWNGTVATITANATAGDTGTGSDTIDGAGRIQFSDRTIFLVSHEAGADYTTIQAAIEAAQDGDTIMIAAGVYNENLTIAGKHLTLTGAGDSGPNGTTLTGQINASGTLTGALAIENMAINATGHQYGVFVSSDGAAGSVVLDNTTIWGAQSNGFAYIRAGNGSTPTHTDTVSAISILNSEFYNNATVNSGGNGRGDVLLYGYNGDLTISNVNIHDPGVGAQKAIQLRGLQTTGVDVADHGPYQAAGDVSLTNLTIHGNYGQDLIAVYNIANFHSFTTTGVDVDASAPWGIINLDGVGGTIDLSSGINAINHAPLAGGLVAHQQGLDGTETFTGTSGNDILDGRAGADTLNGGDGNDVIRGLDGDDMLTGGAGNDIIDGGAGIDTAHYNDSVNVTAAGGQWTVDATASSEGTDTLTNVEKINDGSHTILLVGNGGFSTIQAAIDAASIGDTIMIADGTYAEHLTINKALTLIGSDHVIVQGTFLTDNHITGSVADFLKTATSYTGAAGNGITIAADNVKIQGITVNGFNSAINLGDGIHNTVIKGVTLSGSVNGIYKGTTADVTGLTVDGGTITDDYIGIYFAKVATPGDGMATHITVDGTTFDHLTQKGIYAETLDHASITGITMNDVGQYGGGPAFGANGTNGAGIDINLKYDTYSSIDINNFHFTDVGLSNGLGSSHFNAGAITVKARDDGAYSGTPASFTGTVTIENGTIDGTSTGIRAGEAGKNIAGPAVSVDGVTITNAVHNSLHGDFANVTQSTMTVVGTSGDDVLFASPTTTGPLYIDGGLGDDTITAGQGNDTIAGGDGADTIHGGAGLDTALYASNYGGHTVTWDGTTATVSGGTDTGATHDTIDGAGKIQFADHTVLLVSQAPGADYATIQAALDAANDGDTIMIAAGTYTGAGNTDLVVRKAVTMIGAGNNATIIDGQGIHTGFTVALDHDVVGGSVTFQNLAVVESSNMGIRADDQHILGTLELDGVRVEDSHYQGLFVSGRQTSSAYTQSGVQKVIVNDSTFTDNAHSFGNAADIYLYRFDGDANLTNVAISNTPNGDVSGTASYGIQINGTDENYDVLTPIGHVTLDNVTVSGTYAKTGFYVQGYTDTDGLDFSGSNSVDVTSTSWGKPVVITPTADEMASSPQGQPGEPGHYADGPGNNGSFDLSNLNVVQHGLQVTDLSGSPDADTITGTNANDVIRGLDGDDTLTGGAGNDTFVFTPNFGHDTVTDFTIGADIISIDHTIFVDTAAALAAATQQGADTVITAQNGDTITLQNVVANNLHQNDFHILV